MNSAAVKAFSERAAIVGEELWPATVTIAGVEYAAEVPAPREGYIVGDGRETLDAELVVKIRHTVLATQPDNDQPLTYEDKTWWIDSVRAADLEDRWLLKCTPKK